MSIYNVIHGVNPLAPALLFALDLEVTKIDRLRDCYLARNPDDQSLEIHVLTRTGGGNRADHQQGNAYLAASEFYIADGDSSHDSTYAIFRFRVPEEVLDDVVMLVTQHPNAIPKSPGERFEEFMSALENNPDDPAVKRATELVKPILDQIASNPSDSKIYTI